MNTYEELYYYLWQMKNIRGLSFVMNQYKSLLEYVQNNYTSFDPTLTRPSNELHIIVGNEPKYYTPPTVQQDIMIVGATNKQYKKEVHHRIYKVNLISHDDMHYGGRIEHIDLVYDINKRDFFYRTPCMKGKFFEMIMEHVPLVAFVSREFFELAHYLLQPNGIIKTISIDPLLIPMKTENHIDYMNIFMYYTETCFIVTK
jgi:hypothetical protein